MAPDPRAERDALPQTDGLWTGGPRAALRGLLVMVVRSQREANSQWKSEFSLFSADILLEQRAQMNPLLLLLFSQGVSRWGRVNRHC